jgi:hypothetical protein
MENKRDWVKIVAIILAVAFFVFWIMGTTINSNENELLKQKYDELYKTCQASAEASNTATNQSVELLTSVCKVALMNLNSQWQSSFSTLLNCYKNNIPTCEYSTPALNLTN